MVFPFDKVTVSSAINYSYVRFLNAAPDLESIRISINGGEMHKALKYSGFTTYDKAGKGKYKIEITGNKGEKIVEEISIHPEKIYTIAIIGERNKHKLCIIKDVKRHRRHEHAFVRFVNLSCDEDCVDIKMNKSKIISELYYTEHTDYVTVMPKTYTISASEHGKKEDFLTVPNAHLKAENYYAVYLVGMKRGHHGMQMLIPLEGTTYLEF